METNNYPDLNKICRLCLSEDADVFNMFKSELSIPLRIMACTTLEVKESDNLPSNICAFCRIQLEKFYLFRKKCQSADLKLRKHIRQINSGKISKVFCRSEEEDEEDYNEDCLNSQKFIETFEEEERLNKEEIREKEKLGYCHKDTQTQSNDIENKSAYNNIQEITLPQKFIIREQDQDGSFSNNKEDISEKSPKEDSPIKDEDDSDEIIYLIENEGSDSEYENRQELEVYVEEEDESFLLKNESNETESRDTEGNTESIGLIDNSCVLEKEKHKPSKVYDIDIVSSENEMTIINEKEYSLEHQHVPDNKIYENKDAKLFKCHICPQSFSRVFLLDKHLSLHKKNKNHVCSVCKKHFAAKSSLDRHSRIHNGEKPYKCDTCGKAFIQNEILKRHRYLHFDKKPFECSHCDQAFIQKNLLQHHITIKHSNKPIPKLFNCDICPKAFVHSSGLSRHLILHSGITYSCEYCKKSFTDKSALKRHKETHFKVKS